MSKLRERWISALLVALILAGSVAWYAWPSVGSETEASLYAPIHQGTFKIAVTTTGELRASKFVEITGPPGAQTAGIFQSKISSLVPEGTVVKTGDVIAELDPSSVATQLNQVQLNLQKAQADFTAAELDSALALAQAREDVQTAEYALEEKKLAKEQEQYEAPSVKRQAEIDLEKAQRALEQSKRNLDTKTKQAIAKMSSVGADLNQQEIKVKSIQDVMGSLTIRAPSPGMVIYVREWNGKKKGVGAGWSPWDPTVATLPDLTQMVSNTYVNEVDIRKLAVGQHVVVTLDADPSKRLPGMVTEIANVGEQRPNQDSKVFEVKIRIVQVDTTLRPGMTTGNQIETASIANVLSIPLEAVTNENGFSYVYKKVSRGVVKQMIETGPTNDNEIVVQRGLAKTDHVLLVPPANKNDIETITIPGLKPTVTPTSSSDTSKRT
jgi:multidrug efflux pump subunit AcrA (membrane-fusion protein)